QCYSYVFDQSQSQGSITLKIIPAVVYLRALFDYTPFDDKATPCQEAGLPFKRGDILQVVSQEDTTWWQAKKVGDCNLRAALIPSTQFQESLRRSFRLKKDRQSAPGEAHTPDANHTDFLIYEEVTQYLPRPSERPRLIVLIGRSAVGFDDIEETALVFLGLFAIKVTLIHNGTVFFLFFCRFIEYGEYKDNLYGTSLESINRVLDQNKVCLVDVQPEFSPPEMNQSAERMEECYGHWVDYVLVREDPVSALAELQVVLERVQMEPQWVPVSWVRS
uniref:MAGUK p55 scaffold protein 3 n=1 Tax=Seriola lalandi dorsalis TaxID=1841481 RepID=A0A3B4Y3S7_SERLL